MQERGLQCQIEIKKKHTDFEHMMISNVLCDLPFIQNQPLKLLVSTLEFLKIK